MASPFTPLLTASALILLSCGAGAQAPQRDTSNPPPQTRSSERQQTFSRAELEELVAPIALYSDPLPLLARVLMASNHPLEVAEASRWVKQNKHLKGSELLAAAEKQNWVYSVRQLTATPSVLTMMTDKLDWTRKLKHAVLVQQPDVFYAVQRVRAVAQAQDALKATDEQKVARRTEDNRDVGAVAQAPQPDTSNPPPQTQSGEGQEQRGAVAQAQDTLKATDEQKVAPRTEDNRDVGAVAQAPQPDTSNPPPQTQSGERQERRDASSQAQQDKLETTNEQDVARRTEGNNVGAGVQMPQPEPANPPRTQSGERQEHRGTVAQAADKPTTTDQQKVARLTADNKDVGAVAQAPQPDTSNRPPQTQSSEGQEHRGTVAQAADKPTTTDQQKVARRTEGNNLGTVAQAPQPEPSSQSAVPAGWVQQPRQSNAEPLKFTSPDGTAWLTLYATPADKSRRSKDAFEIADGERVTYKRSTRRFVAVSGFRGDRIFYRKKNLACRGTRWHHIAFEYPAEDKRKMDALVTRFAHGMNRFDRDCRGSASETSGGLVRNR